jgi:hypothetical protein
MQFITIDLERPPQIFKDLVDHDEVDWSVEGDLSQSMKFYDQLAINRQLLTAIKLLCSMKVPYFGQDNIDKFLSRLETMEKIQDMEMGIVVKYDKMAAPHVIVLLYNNIYYGHVYVWVSPFNQEVCLMTTPICRVDEPFLEDYPSHPEDVREKLVEASIQFAKNKRCKMLCISAPDPDTKELLENIGFREDSVPVPYYMESMVFHRGCPIYNVAVNTNIAIKVLALEC